MNKQKKSMAQNPGQLINLLIKIKTLLLLQKMWPVLLHFSLKLAADFSPSGLLSGGVIIGL